MINILKGVAIVIVLIILLIPALPALITMGKGGSTFLGNYIMAFKQMYLGG